MHIVGREVGIVEGPWELPVGVEEEDIYTHIGKIEQDNIMNIKGDPRACIVLSQYMNQHDQRSQETL